MESGLLVLRQSIRYQNMLLNRGLATSKIILNSPKVESSSSGSVTAPSYNAPGLSTAVVTLDEPVGPGASKTGEYKVPEYFNYNKNSYFEAEVEMAKYRLPQPSAVSK